MIDDPLDEENEEIDEQLSELLESARQECMGLLDSARFSTWRDIHLRGELTAVSILARPDLKKPETCRIDVVCQSAGHLDVDWRRVPLELVDMETDGGESKPVLARGVLDARGRWSIPLPSGSREQLLRFRNPVIVLELPIAAFAWRAGPPADLLRERASDQLLVTWEVAEVDKQRVLQVWVRAKDAALQGSKVQVDILTKKTGRLRHSGTVQLLAPKEPESLLEGMLEVREEILRTSRDKELKPEKFLKIETRLVADKG